MFFFVAIRYLVSGIAFSFFRTNDGPLTAFAIVLRTVNPIWQLGLENNPTFCATRKGFSTSIGLLERQSRVPINPDHVWVNLQLRPLAYMPNPSA
jgi:hypothetical protein